MPVGIITDDQLQAEIKNSAVVINRERPGRRPGDVNIPDSLRKVISETAITEGNKSAQALAEMFGISSSAVSAYKNDATSTKSYHKPDEELKKHNKAVRASVADTAQGKLILALESITAEKLAEAKLRDVSSVARDMSTVMKNMDENASDRERGNQQPLVLFMPYIRQENEYRTIVVNE